MSPIKALFLAANPSDTSPLKLDEEIRGITEKIRASEHRNMIDLVSAWAVRPDDLLQMLNQHKPQIVHFSGHGSTKGEIILLDSNLTSKPVSTAAIKALFTTLKDNIQIVLLNACYSRTQAESLVEVIDCVIGMSSAIGDKAAITFAASFYRAIGFGRSVKEAFDQGIAALLLEGISEESTPELLYKSDVDPSKLIMLTTPAPDMSNMQTKNPVEQVQRIENHIGRRFENAYELLLLISNSPDLYTSAEILRRISNEETKTEIARVLESSSRFLKPRKQSLLLAYILSNSSSLITDDLLFRLGNPEIPRLMTFFGAPNELIKSVEERIQERFRNDFVRVDCSFVWLGTHQDEIDQILRSGSVAHDYIQIEFPKHRANITPFKMGKFAVTNFQYSLYNEMHNYPEGEDSYPATDLMWKNALDYARWWSVRLPTESEWVAAATGERDLKYPWGNEYRKGLCNSEDTGIRHKLPVDSFPEGISQFGCYNMSGNCWEMVSSLLRPFPYDPHDGRENLFINDNRVIKGGSYSSKLPNIRCNARDYRGMDTPNSKVGFRLALSE